MHCRLTLFHLVHHRRGKVCHVTRKEKRARKKVNLTSEESLLQEEETRPSLASLLLPCRKGKRRKKKRGEKKGHHSKNLTPRKVVLPLPSINQFKPTPAGEKRKKVVCPQGVMGFAALIVPYNDGCLLYSLPPFVREKGGGERSYPPRQFLKPIRNFHSELDERETERRKKTRFSLTIQRTGVRRPAFRRRKPVAPSIEKKKKKKAQLFALGGGLPADPRSRTAAKRKKEGKKRESGASPFAQHKGNSPHKPFPSYS